MVEHQREDQRSIASVANADQVSATNGDQVSLTQQAGDNEVPGSAGLLVYRDSPDPLRQNDPWEGTTLLSSTPDRTDGTDPWDLDLWANWRQAARNTTASPSMPASASEANPNGDQVSLPSVATGIDATSMMIANLRSYEAAPPPAPASTQMSHTTYSGWDFMQQVLALHSPMQHAPVAPPPVAGAPVHGYIYSETQIVAEIAAPVEEEEVEGSASEHTATNNDGILVYAGDESICSLCTYDFMTGEMCLRLACRHMFHTSCYEALIFNHVQQRDSTAPLPDCPNCRARAVHITARFPFIAQSALVSSAVQTDQPVLPADLSPRLSDDPTPSEASSFYPVWLLEPCCVTSNRAQMTQEEQSYINKALSLPSGRMGLIVDPGSWQSLMGDKFAEALLDMLALNGQSATMTQRTTPLNVGGVGHGSQMCHEDLQFPIALRRSDGALDDGTCTSPIIRDSHVPGLLGNAALKRERAIIDCGNNCIYFCGEGEIQIVLPPGSKQYPLESSPSGHMLLPISEFYALRNSTAQQQTQTNTTLVTVREAATPQL